jgi:hypothetical protein
MKDIVIDRNEGGSDQDHGESIPQLQNPAYLCEFHSYSASATQQITYY